MRVNGIRAKNKIAKSTRDSKTGNRKTVETGTLRDSPAQTLEGCRESPLEVPRSFVTVRGKASKSSECCEKINDKRPWTGGGTGAVRPAHGVKEALLVGRSHRGSSVTLYRRVSKATTPGLQIISRGGDGRCSKDRAHDRGGCPMDKTRCPDA